VLEALLGLFTSGSPGQFVSRDDSRPLEITAEDICGSQSVPLVVLVDVDTASYGEVLSGVLRDTGRATLAGRTTLGNVETLWAFEFEDGSRAWIAREAFQFAGQAVGQWEDTGIVPDIFVPTRWDLFTEATDPALATAVAVLQGQALRLLKVHWQGHDFALRTTRGARVTPALSLREREKRLAIRSRAPSPSGTVGDRDGVRESYATLRRPWRPPANAGGAPATPAIIGPH
jgi:C-terminal processing protease CtpA/Prc